MGFAYFGSVHLFRQKLYFVSVGPSVDPASVTMIDSVKVYTKTKEAFGWPKDNEDFPELTNSKVATSSSSTSTASDTDSTPVAPLPLTSVDRLLSSSLEVLDGCFAVTPHSDERVGAVLFVYH